jgi:3-hexulose-6-phosphate synthase/6-phospho-3-hexuloisomerase
MSVKPKLQVALDVANLHRALQIAKEAVEGGCDWIEAGTPLIKSEGLDVVRELKRQFPTHTIVADMKTTDVGSLEVEMASKAGADVICIMGFAHDGTITEAVKAGRRYGSKIMVDLLRTPDPVKRAKEVEEFGADFVCIHIGVDEQMKKQGSLDIVKDVTSKISIPVACAGGINTETASKVVLAGASIIIVGSAIIKSPDVTKASGLLKRSILEGVNIPSELFQKYSQEDLFDAFLKVSTPNIADAMHTKGAMKGIVPRINHGNKMVGRALTVKTIDGDWAKPVEAIDICQANEVIVIDAGGGHVAIWGELASHSCKKKGISGVVIDGAARDVDDILKMGFAVFSRHIAPNAGEPKGHGEIGSEITCGEQVVRSGDWIVGDESGVVVIPKEIAQEIANRALDVKEKENRLREEIRKGSTLSEVLKLKKWEKVD